MIETISATHLADRIDRGDRFALVDTRPADSYEAWHAPGARHFPFEPTEALDARFDELEALIGDDDEVVTICGKGVSSGTLGAHLARSTDAYDVTAVAGGMNDWSTVYHEVSVPLEGPRAPQGGLEVVQLQRRAKGCLSYLIADTDAKAAIVVDATADTDQVLLAAGARGLAIEGVIDTHVHADHVSGGPALADRLGVPYYLPEQALGRAVHHDFEPLADGQVLTVGDVEVEVRHTPGHTSEMISLVVDDRAVCTADTLHVDSVGRTELEFGEADAERGARLLHGSLHEQLHSLPGDAVVLPGHVAVGTDGAFRSGSPRTPITTTIGEAWQSIEALSLDEDDFVEMLADAGAKPTNYEEILTVNRGVEGQPEPSDRVTLEIGPNNCSAGS